jgi:hypothetical protein
MGNAEEIRAGAARRPAALNAAALMAEAQAATGLTDFGGDPAFREGLDVLVDAASDIKVSPETLATIRFRVLNFLGMRLHLVEDAKLHPEILGIRIEKPLIIIGLPRTGTTITFDMLALDTRSRYPRDWEWYMPWPATEAATIDTDPRIAMMQPSHQRAVELDPSLQDVHRYDCSLPGECNTGMMYHFAGCNWWSELGLPKHARWIIDVVPEGLYRDHKRLLQQMQWKGPKGHWLLKSPHHLLDLPGLLRTYPDARLIWTHRDPIMAFSSLADYITKIQPACGTVPDPHFNGRTVVDLWSTAILQALKARDEHPEVDAAIIDLSQAEIGRDPIQAVRQIYAHFDEAMTPEFLSRLVSYLGGDKNAQRQGKHHHRPEDSGIDPDRDRRRLVSYYDRFGHLFAKTAG